MGGDLPAAVARAAGAVFLSYASQDAEAARRIADALRAAGIEVWFDQRELRGGDAWDQKIRHQIRDCALFVPIISANTDARPEGYFRLEWKLAVDRSHLMADDEPFLIPVVVDGIRDATARVPDRFRQVQWTRLPSGETPPAVVERVSRLLAHDLGVAPARPQQTATPAPMLRASSWRTPAFVLIAAGTVIGVSYVAVDKFVLSKRAADVGGASAPIAQATAPAQSPIPEKSIAVLPFVDMSEKKDQEYFGDGMAEEILNLLVTIPELKVIGRTSSFQFKGKPDDLRKIGTTLGAAYVVEGSVRRSGDHIRITAQLIDTRDGAHRWSETYDRDASDVLKVQGDIAANLVRALQLEVTSASHLQGRALPRSDEAYDRYLRGLHAFSRFDQAGFDEAVADFRRTLEIDPSFAPAAEQLANTLLNEAAWGFVPPATGFERARAAAKAVVMLDSKSALGHAVLGEVHQWYDWDWPSMAQEMATAVSLAPADPIVLVIAGQARVPTGDWNEAVRILDAGLAADPLRATLYEAKYYAYLRLGRIREAESAVRRLLEISPTYAEGRYDLGITLLVQDRPEAALSEMLQETLPAWRAAGLAVVYHALHRTKEADAELARLVADHSGDRALCIAETYAFRGQKDQAFHWLERAYAQKDFYLWLVKGDPLLKNLEGDPRYKAFLRKMNLPE